MQANSVPGLFVDVTTRAGISFKAIASHTSQKYLLETVGSGVALFDFDNDGLLDIFFVNGAPLASPSAPGTIPRKGAKRIGIVSIARSRTAHLPTLLLRPAWQA